MGRNEKGIKNIISLVGSLGAGIAVVSPTTAEVEISNPCRGMSRAKVGKTKVVCNSSNFHRRCKGEVFEPGCLGFTSRLSFQR